MKTSPLFMALLGLGLALVAVFLVLFLREGDVDDVGNDAADVRLDEGLPSSTARRTRRDAEEEIGLRGTEPVPSEGEVRDPPGGDETREARPVIMGRVVDAATKSPVAGARVELMSSAIVEDLFSLDLSKLLGTVCAPNRPITAVTTDESGTFRIPRAAPGEYTVLVRAAGFARRFSDSFRLRKGGEAADLVVHLKPGLHFEGVVRNVDGIPVPGARASLLDRGRKQLAVFRSYQAFTDERGRFVFDDLEEGRYSGVVEAKGYGVTSMGRIRVRKEDAQAEPREFILDRESEVFGRVYDITTAKGLEGALVYVLVEFRGNGFPAYLETRSGKDGAYAIKGIPPKGDLLVGARQPGFSLKIGDGKRTRMKPGIPLKGKNRNGDRDLLDLPMVGGATIVGRVIEEGSLAPIANAKVLVHSPNTIGVIVKTGPVRTNANGEFKLEKVPAGPFIVAATHPDHVDEPERLGFDVFAELSESGRSEDDRSHVLEPGEVRSGIQVIMRRGVRLRGRVVDAEDVPVASARVTFERGDTEERALQAARSEVLSDADGRFELVSVPIEDGVIVTAVHPRFVSPGREKVDLAKAAKPPELVLRVGPGAVIEGVVYEADGAPLVEATVVAEPKGLRRRGFLGMQNGDPLARRREVRTDAEGRFRMVELPSGAYGLSVNRRSLLTVRLTAGETRSVELRLPRIVTIDGVTLREDGSVFPQVRVSLRRSPDGEGPSSGEGASFSTTSDERGRFRFAVPAGGMYSVRGWSIQRTTLENGKRQRTVWASGDGKTVAPGDQGVRLVLKKQ